MAMTTCAQPRILDHPRGLEFVWEWGRLRVSALEEGVIRVRVTREAEFPARRSWDPAEPDEAFPLSAPVTMETEAEAILATALVKVTVAKADGRVAFADSAGRIFAADVAQIASGETRTEGKSMRIREGDVLPEGPAKTEWRLRKAMALDEGYYGFGQRTGLLNKRGRRMTNWTVDPEFGHGRGLDNMYQAHPVFLALRPGLAWGLFLHSTWYSELDAGASQPDELSMLTLGPELDYYLFYGPTPAAALERLTRLTGRPFMPPLWALGYHQSRYGYASGDEMRELAKEFRARDLPIDVLHFDIPYMDGYRVFTFDPKTFPRPKKLMAELRKQRIRAVTIVDPGVKYDLYSGYPVAKDGLEKGVFLMNPEPDGTPFTGIVWPGYSLFTDYTRADARAWWGKQHKALTDLGVAGIWNDMNEPSIVNRALTTQESPLMGILHGTPEERTAHAEAHNIWGTLMCRATHEGLRGLRPDERPWVLTRSAFTGVQRCAASWMGDNNSWWEHLEMSLPQLAGLSLCGQAHVGVDIGGFFENCTPELYARWVEMGVFYPFMRTHTCQDTGRQEPWSFGPEVEEIARQSLKLRYRLLPYLYTLSHRAQRTGEPILRPLLYDFPDDAATYNLDDQIMFGPHVLAAPICRPGHRHRMVYLPAGAWYDFWTGARLDGPAWITADAPLERIPLYLRGGAILTLGNARCSTDEPLTTLTLEAYPAGGSCWTLIEDDGISFAFERGEIAETTFHLSEQPSGAILRLDARQGAYQPAPRTLAARLRLPAADPACLRVTFDGAPCQDWSWDGLQRAVEARWPDDGKAHVLRSEG